MKIFLITVLAFSLFQRASAQEFVERTKDLGKGHTEEYHVLKSDKKVMQGDFKIYFADRLEIEGQYQSGKKNGVWTFYSGSSRIAQKYNYDNSEAVYNDTTFNFGYKIAGLKKTDSVKYPFKIGGFCGYDLLLKDFDIPDFIKNVNKGKSTEKPLDLNDWFYIDENGKLINWEVKVVIDNEAKVYQPDLKDIQEEYSDFSPAIVNGKKVPSALVFKRTVSHTVSGRIVGKESVSFRGDRPMR